MSSTYSAKFLIQFDKKQGFYTFDNKLFCSKEPACSLCVSKILKYGVIATLMGDKKTEVQCFVLCEICSEHKMSGSLYELIPVVTTYNCFAVRKERPGKAVAWMPFHISTILGKQQDGEIIITDCSWQQIADLKSFKSEYTLNFNSTKDVLSIDQIQNKQVAHEVAEKCKQLDSDVKDVSAFLLDVADSVPFLTSEEKKQIENKIVDFYHS